MGGENAGAAVLALALALIGLVLIVAGIRGTYGDVWTALKAAPAPAPASNTTSTRGSTGSAGGHGNIPALA